MAEDLLASLEPGDRPELELHVDRISVQDAAPPAQALVQGYPLRRPDLEFVLWRQQDERGRWSTHLIRYRKEHPGYTLCTWPDDVTEPLLRQLGALTSTQGILVAGAHLPLTFEDHSNGEPPARR